MSRAFPLAHCVILLLVFHLVGQERMGQSLLVNVLSEQLHALDLLVGRNRHYLAEFVIVEQVAS